MEHLEKLTKCHPAIDFVCSRVNSQTNIPKALVLMLPLLSCPLYLLMTICSPIQVAIVLLVLVFLFYYCKPILPTISESENARQLPTSDGSIPSGLNVGANQNGDKINNREPSISFDKELYYPMKYVGNKKVGRGIIIVNETFDDPKLLNREGADKDCEYFREIYDKLKINCENNDYYNVNAKTIDYNIESFVRHPETENSSVIFVAISSHGGKDGLINGTSGTIKLGKIFAYFYQYKPLLSIPKVFLIQACRGSETRRKQEHDGLPSSPDLRESSNFATSTSDTLIVYATGDGYTAWRDPKNGSWFVKDLRDCIMDTQFDGRHLVDLLTICTNRVISTHCEGVTETPSYQSTLRRFLLFPPFAPVTS